MWRTIRTSRDVGTLRHRAILQEWIELHELCDLLSPKLFFFCWKELLTECTELRSRKYPKTVCLAFSLEHLTVCELGTVAFSIHLQCLRMFFVKYTTFCFYCAILSFVVRSCKVCIMLFLKAYKVLVCWLGLCLYAFEGLEHTVCYAPVACSE